MIRVAVIDDHPALRAGLRTVLDLEPGIVFAGESDGTNESLWPMLDLVRPDLLLLDYHLPRGDGLQACYRVKQTVPTPKVILFTAYANPALAVPAVLARADGLLPKGAGARELFSAIRTVHSGETLLPPITPATLEEASSQLFGNDRALVGMALDGASERDIAQTLRLDRRDVRHAIQRILSGLRLDVPASGLPSAP
jgi:DNA-binding NarL/FixJ family response regulator